jgi:hypothetical protein
MALGKSRINLVRQLRPCFNPTRDWKRKAITMVDIARTGSGFPAVSGQEPASRPHAETGRAVNWRKAMSDNIAYALLVYTALQIFVTMRAIEGTSGSAMPLLALVVLVAAIIPLCRKFERRWEAMADDAVSDPALRGTFRRDQAMLWALAIGLPFVLTGLFKAIAALV